MRRSRDISPLKKEDIGSRLESELCYEGPIFDAHTHAIDNGSLDLLVEIGQQHGVERTLLISHTGRVRQYAEKKYPGRFIFAKYFSGSGLLNKEVRVAARAIENLLDKGYQVAKLQNAPLVKRRIKGGPESIRFDDPSIDPLFAVLAEKKIPFLIHMSDPDTYYATKYANRHIYNTKEKDLQELEMTVARHPDVNFQLAHFAAQPEMNRLPNLARWMDTYPNFTVDTASARWMARELSRNPEKTRDFLIKYQDRVVFGTDCIALFRFGGRTSRKNYYDLRYLALRLLLETNARKSPLPFKDKDTANTGGTFINGLSLPNRVLKKIYWKNAVRFYGET